MDIVKYICDFFFGDFWHWLELLVLVCAVRGITFEINKHQKQDDEL